MDTFNPQKNAFPNFFSSFCCVCFFWQISSPREEFNTNFFLLNRRVIYVKEVEILGHLTTEWDYLFEDFRRSPSYEANVLKITVLVRKVCKLFY